MDDYYYLAKVRAQLNHKFLWPVFYWAEKRQIDKRRKDLNKEFREGA
jgi:hypothetical protein